MLVQPRVVAFTRLPDHRDNLLPQLPGGVAEEIVDGNVVIPEGQDILTTEEIKADISIIPYGHASFIGITIGFINPLRVA